MVVEEVVNVSSGLIGQIGQMALWLQTLGIVVALWIIFQAFNSWIAWKRFKEVIKIKADMKRLESKLDRVLDKKK